MKRPRRPSRTSLLLTMTEAARRLRVRVKTLHAMIGRGAVPIVRFGRTVRVYAPARYSPTNQDAEPVPSPSRRASDSRNARADAFLTGTR
jgi:excisionase family DNA binding protein